MARSVSAFRPCLILALSVILTSSALAQLTGVSNSTSTPIPGAGHDYIKMLSETVDPANGSVSLRLQVPVPPSRGFTIPFSFAYDSNGVHFPISGALQGQSGWGEVKVNYGVKLGTFGWSYAVPSLNWSTVNFSQPMGGGTCSYTGSTGFVFQDPTGGRHSLRLSHADQPSPLTCSPHFSEFDSDGDDYYRATLSAGVFPTIVDADGTTYSFGNADYVGTGVLATFLPRIEDRNGNIFSFSSAGLSGAFVEVDTAGRSVISSSGFGQTGNTISVSGLSNPYTVTWGTATSNFHATPNQDTWPQPDPFCTFIPLDNETEPVITAITLPNNQQYKFLYDPTYGELKQVTYPTGGYVKYTWGLNPSSAVANFTPTSGASGGVPCEWIYSKPAITDRYVSFDGITLALHQHFQYATNWNSSAWTTKTTVVTTTDVASNVSTTTTYTYVPVPGPFVPDNIYLSDNQIPVEQSVVYQDGSSNTLKTVTKTWVDQYELASEQDTLNSVSSLVKYTYGPGAQVTEKDEYDFGAGASGGLLRKTITNYQSFAATPIYTFAPSLFDRPCQTIIYDSTGTTRVAETDYFYDGTTSTTPCATATTQALSGTGSYTGHDEPLYGTTATVPRGNLTKTIHSLIGGTSPTTTYSYDETGQILSMTDPCGNGTCSDMSGTHTTTYSFADNYSSGIPPAATNAYLTKITDPLGDLSSFAYGYSDDYTNGERSFSISR